MEKIEKKIKIIEDQHGFKYYDKLPPGTRVAQLDDFYDHRGRLIINKPYLVKSMKYESRYWANRVNRRFPYTPVFKQFLEDQLVFVWEDG